MSANSRFNSNYNSNNGNGSSELEAILGAMIAGARYGIKIRLPHAFVMTFLFKRQLTTQQKLNTIFKLTLEHASNLASFATLYKTILAILKILSQTVRKQISSSFYEKRFQWLGRTFLLFLIDGPSSSLEYTNNLFPSITSTPLSSSYNIPAGVPQSPYHSFVAGLIGGYSVWGRYSSVNYQIVLYLTSRVLTGLVALGVENLRHSHLFEYLFKGHSSATSLSSSSLPSHISSNTTTTTTQSSSSSSSWLSWLTFERAYPLYAASIWGAVMVLFETYPHVLHPSLKISMDEVYRNTNFFANNHDDNNSEKNFMGDVMGGGDSCGGIRSSQH